MADSSAMYVSKKMQYAKLRDELEILGKNIDTLDRNVKDTVDQVPSFRKMGTLHASILMSMGSVLNNARDGAARDS